MEPRLSIQFVPAPDFQRALIAPRRRHLHPLPLSLVPLVSTPFLSLLFVPFARGAFDFGRIRLDAARDGKRRKILHIFHVRRQTEDMQGILILSRPSLHPVLQPPLHRCRHHLQGKRKGRRKLKLSLATLCIIPRISLLASPGRSKSPRHRNKGLQ